MAMRIPENSATQYALNNSSTTTTGTTTSSVNKATPFTTGVETCVAGKERLCPDGSCVPRSDLCPEEALINQNTIMIMILVGVAVIVFVVILYCLQQRKRNRRTNQTNAQASSASTEGDNISLYMPPPTYEDVMSSQELYPATPIMRLRTERLLSDLSQAEVPITPPPNYDHALHILSKSQEYLAQNNRSSGLFRRSVSLSFLGARRISKDRSPPPPFTPPPPLTPSPPAPFTPTENEVFFGPPSNRTSAVPQSASPHIPSNRNNAMGNTNLNTFFPSDR